MDVIHSMPSWGGIKAGAAGGASSRSALAFFKLARPAGTACSNCAGNPTTIRKKRELRGSLMSSVTYNAVSSNVTNDDTMSSGIQQSTSNIVERSFLLINKFFRQLDENFGSYDINIVSSLSFFPRALTDKRKVTSVNATNFATALSWSLLRKIPTVRWDKEMTASCYHGQHETPDKIARTYLECYSSHYASENDMAFTTHLNAEVPQLRKSYFPRKAPKKRLQAILNYSSTIFSQVVSKTH